MNVIQNAELLQGIIDAPNLGLAVYKAVRDENGNIVDFVHEFINQKTRDTLGQDFTGRMLSAHGPDGVKQIDLFRQVIESQKPNSYVLRAESGVVQGWFLLSNAPISGDRLVHTWEDVTALKQAEQEAKESKELLESVLQNTASSIMMLKPVRDNNDSITDFEYRYVNEPALRSVSRTDLVGKTLLQEFPLVRNLALFNEYVKVMESGDDCQREFNMSEYEVGVWAQMHARRIGNELLVTYFDITGHKNTEHEILRLKDEIAQKVTDKYYSIFNSIDEGFCICEVIYDNGNPVDLRWVEVNPAYEKQTGLKGSVGKLVSDVMPGTESYWIEMYDQVARTGAPADFENWHGPTGRWYHIFASRISGAGR